MPKAEYQGFIINARPRHLADGTWSLNLEIWSDNRASITTRGYSAANTFKTEEEAIQHCLNFGRQAIDGEVPGCEAP